MLLSVIIPARDEAECLKMTVSGLAEYLRLEAIPFEIVIVDDGSSDPTYSLACRLMSVYPEVHPVINTGEHGFGLAAVDYMPLQLDCGDASESDHPRLFLCGGADYLAQSLLWHFEAEDTGDGQPLPIYRPVSVAGEAFGPKRLRPQMHAGANAGAAETGKQLACPIRS